MMARLVLLNLITIGLLGCSDLVESGGRGSANKNNADVAAKKDPAGDENAGAKNAADANAADAASGQAVASVPAASEPVKLPTELPELAFHILKTNDIKALPKLVITVDDGITILKKYAVHPVRPRTKDETVEVAKAMVERSIASSTRWLGWVRRQIAELGFDWSKATLEEVTLGRGGRPYDSSSKSYSLDIYLKIRSGRKSIIVKLDDCIRPGDERRLNGGFRLVNSKWREVSVPRAWIRETEDRLDKKGAKDKPRDRDRRDKEKADKRKAPPKESRYSTQQLIERLKDKDKNVRSAAARGLGWKPASEAVPALVEALADEDRSISTAARRALPIRGRGAEIAVPLLIEVLKGKNTFARCHAALALGEIGRQAEAAVPALIEAAKDENKDVRRLAADALQQIQKVPQKRQRKR